MEHEILPYLKLFLRKMRANATRPPVNITEVTRILEMSEYLPVFVLNGYEVVCCVNFLFNLIIFV